MNPTNSPATSQGHGATPRKLGAGRRGSDGQRNDRASRTCFASARPAWVILLALLVVGCESPCKEHIVGDGWNTANFCTRSDHVIEVVDGHTVCRCPRKDGGE